MADTSWRRALSEDEIPAAFRNVYGDRSETPLSVQMADVGVEFTPAGTIFGINDIKEELQKEEPDYYKIGMMAGIEAIGIIPGLGDAAIAAIKAGAKKAGLDKIADQTDALLSSPKAEDSIKTEIIAGPGAKSYYNRNYDRAKELEARGYSAAQIEAETGRVKTGTPDDYLDNKPKTLADISSEYANLIGVRDHMEGMIKSLEAEDLSTWATDYPHIKDPSAYIAREIDGYKRQIAEINEKIAKFEKANPADEAGILIKPRDPFKFEIDDSNIKIKSNDGNQTLSEATKHSPIIVRNIIPDHKELFKEYPDLEYVEFYVDDAATYAHFSPTRGRHGAIVVNPKLKEELADPNNESFRDTFFHELQHAAQFQDFKITGLRLLGGNPTYFGEIIAKYPNSNRYEPLINRNKKLVQLKDEIVAIFEKQRGTGALDQRSTGARLPGEVPNPSEVFGDVEVAKQIARKMRELDAELFKTYMSTASEIEARVVGSRAQKLGESPTSRVVSDLSDQRNIETKEEYAKGKGETPFNKKKAEINLKLGSMTDEEILRYANGGINFARYTVGIDKELFGFNSQGPLKGNYAEGGKVGNMNMQKQMSLFEYGGIADDGMTKDPVSGNNIPPGSLAKEVRDDIPAMLSEGEYVVPADVLRYYGVNFFENLRGQAKQGLQNMEQNGRIGGTPMTQQDVARNMQQPTMAPAPVQAAQGTMMQSPIRIQQQPAPQAMGNSGMQQQPVMANQGTMVQGFNQGPMPTAAQYRSSWTPAKARYSSPMFQGTSSQQANIEAAQAEADATAGQEITQSRKHYNQQGESAQVEYVGTDPSNMSIKQTEANLSIAAAYPLTEEEWLAYKKEMGRSDDGGGNGGGETEPTGSSTDWMDGIDWNDQANVKEWADKTLGISKGARELGQMGGIFGAAVMGTQANDIAKVRGVLEYYKSIGDEDMVKYLEPKVEKAVEEGGLLVSALDKLGLITGNSYLKQLQSLGDPDFQKTISPELRKQFTDISGDMVKDESGASVYKPGGIDVAMVDTSDDGPSLTAAEQHAVNMSRARSAATSAAVEEAFESGASTDDIAGLKEAVEKAGGTWATGGRAEGGLMIKGKPSKKKTRKYNKGGLAGKKK